MCIRDSTEDDSNKFVLVVDCDDVKSLSGVKSTSGEPLVKIILPPINNCSPSHLKKLFALLPDKKNSPLLLIKAAGTLSDTNPSFSSFINNPLPELGIDDSLIILPVVGLITLFSDALVNSEADVACKEAVVNSKEAVVAVSYTHLTLPTKRIV